MGYRLHELVEQLKPFHEIAVLGDPNIMLHCVTSLESAHAKALAFLSNPKRREQAISCSAGALLLTPEDSDYIGERYQGVRLVARNPYACYARAAQFFAALEPRKTPYIHPTAIIDATAHVAPTATIQAYVVIGAQAHIADGVIIGVASTIGEHVKIGAASMLHARVVIAQATQIGARCVIQSGAVIGSDGFGFANESGRWIKIPQTGRVLIGDDVEVGANTTIDRGALDDTVIENGVKLDNQIQIGHNCRIGEHTAMAGCVGVAGSAIIGKHCTFGGAAMVLGHLSIADHVHISSGSLVSRSIHQAGQYTGFYPLAKNAAWEKSAAIIKNLNRLREKIRALEKNIRSLI